MNIDASFYGIMPNNVRYSKDLNDFDKVLYTEISSLCKLHGYCFASNAYFSECFDKSTTWISKSISKLEKKGFISVFIEKNNTRKIFEQKSSEGVGTVLQGGLNCTSRGFEVQDNIIIKYNINNNIAKNEKNEICFDIQEFSDFLESLNKRKLQNEFYYKIGDDQSYLSFSQDFWDYCKSKGKKITPKNAEMNFRRYLHPKWETPADIENMKRDFEKRLNRKTVSENVERDAQAEKQKLDEDSRRACLYMSNLKPEELEILRNRAEKIIFELTKGKAKEHRSYGAMVQRKMERIILEEYFK